MNFLEILTAALNQGSVLTFKRHILPFAPGYKRTLIYFILDYFLSRAPGEWPDFLFTLQKKKKKEALFRLHGRLEKETGFELVQLFSQAAEDLTLNNSPSQLQLQLQLFSPLENNASSATLRVGTYSPIYLILYFFT